jgi:hypothetical protein
MQVRIMEVVGLTVENAVYEGHVKSDDLDDRFSGEHCERSNHSFGEDGLPTVQQLSEGFTK